MGVSLVVCQLLGIHDSFTFSAGLFDYLLNWGIAQKPWMLIPIGLAFAVVYFFVFYFFIKIFDIKTPGREDDEDESGEKGTVKASADDNLSELAEKYLALLGGKENIREIEACITRMRLILNDNTGISESDLKALGAAGVMKAGNEATQVIVGTKAELLVDEMKKLL